MPLIPAKLEEQMGAIKEIGIWKIIIFNIAYIWSLFLVGLYAVFIYNMLYPLDFKSESSFLIVSAIFAIITTADFYLLYVRKPTIVLSIWIIVVAIPYTLYKWLVGSEMFALDNKKISSDARMYIFRKRIFSNL